MSATEHYCRELACYDTTYGSADYCRAHLPWLLCRPTCEYCRGTKFAIYGLWAHEQSLVCLDASNERQLAAYEQKKSLMATVPVWATGRVANSRHPQKQLTDVHWREHMNEYSIFIASLELLMAGSYAPGPKRMIVMREFIEAEEIDEVANRLNRLSAGQLAARIDSYLATHPAQSSYCPQHEVNKWVASSRATRLTYTITCSCMEKRTVAD